MELDVLTSAGTRLRRQLQHDIRHQLGTIMMLASVIGTAPDVGPDSRTRIDQMLGEARWMDQLLRAYDAAEAEPEPVGGSEPVSVDQMTTDVVAALAVTRATGVSVVTTAAWAAVDGLALWRALRNILDNAFRAAGDDGRVTVRVFVERGWVVAEVDDDGPGFGAGPAGLASLGLGIVRDFAARSGGRLEIGEADVGGCRVRIELPAVPAP